MCFDLNTGFARLINTHSVLFGNVARPNLQFDVLDLNTGLALVVKTLPDGTFSSIWVNRDGIRTLFRFVNTLVSCIDETNRTTPKTTWRSTRSTFNHRYAHAYIRTHPITYSIFHIWLTPQGDHNISSTQNDQSWLVNYA